MVLISLPTWIETKYKILWEEFKDREFTYDEAERALREKVSEKASMEGVLVLLSELRKAGWLKVFFDPEDARRRLYKLKSKEEILKESVQEVTRGDIEAILKKAADLIRTRVDYKFILVLLFLKRISDKWELEYGKAYQEALKDGFSEEEAKEEAKNAIYHDFDIPEEYLWENIRKDVNRLPEKFSQALKVLAERNPELKDILDTTDFIQFTTNRENAEILRQLVELFSERKLHNVSPDILGDAYEWILRYFAPQKAKEGEVLTPREVIWLLMEILDPKPNQSVYDPACASCGMLIIAYQYVEKKYGKKEAQKLFLYGQEANHKSLAFGRMNLYIHDIRNANLALGDTLLYPKFKEQDMVKQFDIVVANPPWNQDGYDENVIKKGDFWKKRFPYGFSPKQSADWIWIQHMLTSSKEKTGKVGVVIDNGCLFRGGKEKAIRAKVIEADLIECVILLPEKLFYNTGAPGAIIIFNKNKSQERKNKILFINASKEYGPHPDVRKLNILEKKHIEKIKDAYKEFKDIEGFARVVDIDEIKRNDFNLNVSLYAYPEEEVEEIDIKKEWEELDKVENEIVEVKKKIESYIKEIGY